MHIISRQTMKKIWSIFKSLRLS